MTSKKLKLKYFPYGNENYEVKISQKYELKGDNSYQ